MTNSPTGVDMTNFLAEATRLAAEVKRSFECLSPQQLNWKPHPEQWSIGQCLHHLVIANESFFTTFETVLKGEKKAALWERMPLLPSLFGKLVIKAVSPESATKLKAPKAFRPSSSNIDARIVADFGDRQSRLIEKMKASARLKLESTIITSPATSLITYSLRDAFKIILAHERRHVSQARRVMELKDFPRYRFP